MAVENGESPSYKQQTVADWEGISHDVYNTVREAQKRVRHVQSRHEHNLNVNSSHAAKCKASLLTAADYLDIEVRKKQDDEPFDEIWDRWEDHLIAVQNVNFRTECPDEIIDFMDDIREAAYEIGYLKPRSFERPDPEDDSAEVLEAMKR